MTQPDLFSSRIVELPHDHLEVYRCIEQRRGRAAGILQAELAQLTGFNTRVVRQIIKELIEDYGVLVGSGSTGFYIPVCENEVQHIVRDLCSRAMSILGRMCAIEKNPDVADLVGQLRMRLEVSHA